MGNATSSALRAENTATPVPAPGADGPVFGSLANLGGPRKFKKKPVLVLDPEELEKAHLMFQEASAELLGEEPPRPERGTTLLGLAPMDDEDAAPEDMGEPDDSEAGEDNEDIPTAEEVLRMTDTRVTIDLPADELIAQQLEGLDIDRRIFPSLPLKSEEEIAAEEEAERVALEARTRSAEPDRAEMPGDDIPISFAAETPGTDTASHHYPVDPLSGSEAESESVSGSDHTLEPAAEATFKRAVFDNAPFLDFPSQPLRFEMPDHIKPAGFAHDPAPVETEFGAQPDTGTTREAEWDADKPDRFDWNEDETHLGLLPDEFESEAEPEPEPEPEHDPEGSYTETDDEEVDGYAFMYAANPRGRTLHALSEGESNSLRAKLVKEREGQQAVAAAPHASPSLFARLTAWLRGLVG